MGRIEFPVLVKRIGIGNGGGGGGVLILIGSIPDPAGISVPMPNQGNTKIEGLTLGGNGKIGGEGETHELV